LIVADVPSSARFYRDLVGLIPETEPSSAWAWFSCGRPNQRLALHAGPLLFEEHSPHPPGRRFGPVHFALETPRADLSAAVARLKAAGVAVHGPTRLERMRAESVYFYDPDGNLVEFWSPDP
jgi:catechol-2,3-dioxygenase